MNDNELNTLALRAQAGCEQAAWRVKHYFQPMIHNLSDRNWHRIKNEEKFEHECFQRIDEAIRMFDASKGNFAWQARFRINERLRRFIKRNATNPLRYAQSLDKEYDDGEGDSAVKTEIRDDLAVVDDNFLTQEKIALLAEDDSRKLAILKAWMSGVFNDSQAALSLAGQCGGNAESHRKFITRFRTTCRKALA